MYRHRVAFQCQSDSKQVRTLTVVMLATHLMSNALQVGQSEVWLVTSLPVVLLEFIQVCSQQLAHKEQVLLQAVCFKFLVFSQAYFCGVCAYNQVLATNQLPCTCDKSVDCA